jgi:hypothetical protein
MSTRKVTALRQRKARPISRLIKMNPSKGINNLGSPALIDDREFSDSLNIEYDENGVARKRNGYTEFLAGLTAPKGLGLLVTETIRHEATIDSGTFKYSNVGGAFTSVVTVSFNASAEVTFTQARDKLYVWNGVEGGSTWDGTTLARPGTMPKAKFGVFYSDKHIVAGVDGQPSRLYISQSDDASAFTRAATLLHNSTEVPGATVFSGTTANFIDVRKNDGDKITGVARYQDLIIVFKEKSIYQLTFDENGDPAIDLITGSTGCVSHKSIDNVENDLYFLSREGVRVFGNEADYFAALRTNVISGRIQTLIDSINPSYYTKANAIYYDNKYFLSIPTTGSAIARTLVYDRRFKAWSIWDNFNSNAFLTYVDSNNDAALHFLEDGGTQVHRVTPGTYNDDGTAIDAYLVSKAFDMGNPDITKYFLDIGLVFRRLAGIVTVSVYEDSGLLFGSTQLTQGSNDGMGLLELGLQVLGEGTGDTSETSTFADNPIRVKVGVNSKVIKFKIQNDRLNESFVFLGYIIGFYPYSHFLFDSEDTVYI